MESINYENTTQLSYLQARDPSILAWNKRRSVLKSHKVNLAHEALQEESLLTEEVLEEPTLRNIQIYLRVKRVDSLGDLYELDDNTIHCFVPDGSYNKRNAKVGQQIKRSYTFSHIFDPTSTQEDVFNHTVKPRLLDLVNGKNSTLMTYGASGSGKTFTIVGTAGDPGIIPRSLEYLFGSLPQLSDCPKFKPNPTGTVITLAGLLRESEKNARNMLLTTLSATIDKQHIDTYQEMQQRLSSEPVAEVEQHKDVSIAVWVSFAEIYNEQIFDLLAPEPLKGKTRTRLQLGKSNTKTYIKNLTYISVSNGLEAYQILQYGLHNLKYAATAINSHSSRSHCIFTIQLVQALESNSDSYHISYFNFCDLAGSERSKKTQNAGERLKESNNINTSLLVLGRCISCIRDQQHKNDNTRIIPYRDSKLTTLFQTALSGKEDIAFVVNVNPSLQMFDESMHVLNFSAIAKQIAITSGVNQNQKVLKKQEDKTFDRRVELLEDENDKLREMVLDLHNEIEQQKNQFEENITLGLKDYQKTMNKIEEFWKNKLELMKRHHEEDKELALEKLREEYEQRMENKPKRLKGEIINLDSDCEDEEHICRCTELNDKVNTLQSALTKCSFDRQILENELSKSRKEIIALEEHNREIRMHLMPHSNELFSDDEESVN